MYRDPPPDQTILRLDRIERKVDRCLEQIASASKAAEVHAAVCDSDRLKLAAGVKTANGRIWKIAIALVALAGGSAAGVQAVQALF